MSNHAKNRRDLSSHDASQVWRRRLTSWKSKPSQSAEPESEHPSKPGNSQPEAKQNTFAGGGQSLPTQPTVCDQADTFGNLGRQDCKSSSAASLSTDDSMNSRRLRDLHLHDKARRPAPGQKRAPEESADGDRRHKLSKSPETSNEPVEAKVLSQERLASHLKSHTNPISSVDDTLHSVPLRQSSSGPFRRPAASLVAHAGRSREASDKEPEPQDLSEAPSGKGVGADDNHREPDTSIVRQPDTKPITSEQLVNEVKGIYSGLVMVEKKCVEIITERAQAKAELSDEQWQALSALHRTLLHEHHDFFLASQHPTASLPLKRLATKYAMPARMWRNGIHGFLELLRQQLPGSYDHMLAFVYVAYSMMALLMESVPSFLETWVECLGDLARYRMAIEESNMRERDNWSDVARMWYNKAADLSPNVGRIHHHLAVLARPAVVMQLSFYSKALVSVVPFPNAGESIMLLFSPFLDSEKATSTFQKYSVLESSFVTSFGILFTRGEIKEYLRSSQQYLDNLDHAIVRMGAIWKTQGPEVASSLMAGLLDFGNGGSFLWKAFKNNMATVNSLRTKQEEPPDPVKLELEDTKNRESIREEFWHTVNEDKFEFVIPPTPQEKADPKATFTSSDTITAHVLPLFYHTTATVAQKIGDKNIGPFMVFILSFLWSLAYIPGGLMFVEAYVPWLRIITFLNTLGRCGVSEERIESASFPQPISGTGRQLPEDFPMRGLIWAQYVFPATFFRNFVIDEDERMLELPSHAASRAERCLWLGIRLSTLNRYFIYHVASKQFEATEYARTLERESANHTFGAWPRPLSGADEKAKGDVEMTETA